MMANGANLLVLDEPTNHLDLPAIEQLEQALDGFAGTVVLVTHDRAAARACASPALFASLAGRSSDPHLARPDR